MAPAVAAQGVSRSTVNAERARAVGTAPSASIRAKQPVVIQRGGTNVTTPRTRASAVARNVGARATSTTKQVTRSTSRVSRAAHILTDAGNIIVRRALGLARATTNHPTKSRTATTPSVARSAAPTSLSRARATAVFSDISKMGEGYTRCRESYNTCMDQFCAGMNETYRRCYCSDNFRNLRDKEEAMDAATTMLAKFEDNNLNAVSLSADEVNAMYSATAGESAIKKDTSGAAAMLDEIGDLLSGKKKAKDTSLTSLSGMSIDFSSDLGDIFGGSNSLFGDSSTDLTKMEGTELYNNAHNQCLQMVSASCENAAVKNMTKSAYGVLITQDCNAYQKNLDAKTEKVKQTVRQAEKMLREARLDEYRAHNSADVNECMDKVEKAILTPTACGTNYEKCMDYTGIYINATTGDPIYSARLFGLIDIINLNGKTADVLAQNKEFDKFLDSKRMFAATALDTCRTMADTVWTEFKRNALIKISQAQDEKIEEIKMSCVSTMKECYDTQSDALKSFDDTTAQASAALAARASRDMCSDKVLACAALYSKEGSEQCKLDSKGKVSNASTCGLKSLLAFVENVDDTRISEGCGASIENYLKQLCTPTSGDEEYPWNCRSLDFSNLEFNGVDWKENGTNKNDFVGRVVQYAVTNCGVNDKTKELEPRSQETVKRAVQNLAAQLILQLSSKCDELDGVWVDVGSPLRTNATNKLVAFYSKVFGGKDSVTSVGGCYENTTRMQCLALNTDTTTTTDDEGNTVSTGTPIAQYDATNDECILSDRWYAQQCSLLDNGYFENGVCYVSH